jgi:hypothetical protein
LREDDRPRKELVGRHVVRQWDGQIDDNARHGLHPNCFCSVTSSVE